MIEVRIRREWSAKAVHLTDVLLDEIGSVIPTVMGWGIADADGQEVVGQFVVDDEVAAYFELVILDDEE